jgi:hypothetical protein
VEHSRAADRARRNLDQMATWANGSENIWYVSLAPWLTKPASK